MSYADKVFINMCRDIIDNGTDTRGEKVRPVWEDGTPASRLKEQIHPMTKKSKIGRAHV